MEFLFLVVLVTALSLVVVVVVQSECLLFICLYMSISEYRISKIDSAIPLDYTSKNNRDFEKKIKEDELFKRNCATSSTV